MRHYNAVERPPKVRLEGFEKTRTKQSEAAACDINTIMARYEKTGILPQVNAQPFYADVSELVDYRQVVEDVRRAEEYFMQLPADLRGEFGNDPAAFLEFVADPANVPQLEEMGLLESDKKGSPEPVPVTPAEPPA